jgi:hypothetical protein
VTAPVALTASESAAALTLSGSSAMKKVDYRPPGA